MVEVKIYPACVKCDCPSFNVLVEETREYDTVRLDGFNYLVRSNEITCEYERVCKFIDGQEPIDIGNSGDKKIEIGEQCK